MVEQSPHILVVDDHRDIREPLAAYLQKNEYRSSTASNAAEARDMLVRHAFDLVVLDIMMPGEDGLSLCRYLRENTAIPVILLTARADEADRIVGLEIGADDYVIKPFSPRELLARIKSVLRRVHMLPPSRDRAPAGTKRLGFDRFVFDTERRELIDENGVTIPLSTSEYRLLSVLTQRPHITLTRDQLLDLTAGRDAIAFDRSIDNQVSRLRKKLERDPKNPELLKTVWGGGYMLASDVRDVP